MAKCGRHSRFEELGEEVDEEGGDKDLVREVDRDVKELLVAAWDVQMRSAGKGREAREHLQRGRPTMTRLLARAMTFCTTGNMHTSVQSVRRDRGVGERRLHVCK